MGYVSRLVRRVLDQLLTLTAALAVLLGGPVLRTLHQACDVLHHPHQGPVQVASQHPHDADHMDHADHVGHADAPDAAPVDPSSSDCQACLMLAAMVARVGLAVSAPVQHAFVSVVDQSAPTARLGLAPLRELDARPPPRA